MANGKMKDFEQRIIDKLAFNTAESYFGGLNSKTLSDAFYKARFAQEERIAWFAIQNFDHLHIARKLKDVMELNPLRWEKVVEHFFTLGANQPVYIPAEYCQTDLMKEAAGHLENFCALTDRQFDLYPNGLASVVCIGDKGDDEYNKLAELFNVFRRITKQNVEDFKDKNSGFRKGIAQVMHDLRVISDAELKTELDRVIIKPFTLDDIFAAEEEAQLAAQEDARLKKLEEESKAKQTKYVYVTFEDLMQNKK
jgi:hypothetical protein